jgi:hypothetical protein
MSRPWRIEFKDKETRFENRMQRFWWKNSTPDKAKYNQALQANGGKSVVHEGQGTRNTAPRSLRAVLCLL